MRSYYFISSVFFFFIGFVSSINRYYDVIMLLTHCTLTSACFIRRIIGGRDEKESVAIYSSPFTLLLGNEHRVAALAVWNSQNTAFKNDPTAAVSPIPPRESLPREGERERGRDEGGKGGGEETDAHIKHILLLWHRKRKTHDVCGSPCFLEPFKVTAARVASAPFSTSSGPYLDNGMLRAACHDVQKSRSTFNALPLESWVYRS